MRRGLHECGDDGGGRMVHNRRLHEAAAALGSEADRLATSTGFSDAYQHVIEEVNASDSRQSGTVNPLVRSDMVYFETPKGGGVFSVGSIAYAGALRYNDYQNNVARITENVLRRFASDEPLPGPGRAPPR